MVGWIRTLLPTVVLLSAAAGFAEPSEVAAERSADGGVRPAVVRSRVNVTAEQLRDLFTLGKSKDSETPRLFQGPQIRSPRRPQGARVIPIPTEWDARFMLIPTDIRHDVVLIHLNLK